MRLNRKTVGSLTLPKNKPYLIVWDDSLPGFGVRVNPTNRVWVVQYRVAGKSRRETIGRVEAVSLEAARDSARKTLARVRLGDDPYAVRAEAKARSTQTFQLISARYLQSAKTRLKPRSFEEVERHLRKHWANLADLPIQKIDRSIVAARLEEIGHQNGPIAANRARAALSALYTYAMGMGLAERNPVIGTLKPGEEIKRDHVLTDKELPLVWDLGGQSDYGRITRILMLTGQRRDEVGQMTWSEIDFNRSLWVLPPERTKNGRAHEIHLARPVISILKATPRLINREFVFGSGKGGFSGWSKAKVELDQRLEESGKSIRPWRLHDLRRTVATGMASLGIPPHIVEAVLNHVSGTRAGVAGIYNRAAYRDEKRDALNHWARHIVGLPHEH